MQLSIIFILLFISKSENLIKKVNWINWNFIAYIVVSLNDPVHEKRCVGTLIAPRWVLTSANCFDIIPDVEDRKISVILGEHDLNNITTQGVFGENFCFPNYNRIYYRHDICLVRLEKEVYPQENDVGYLRFNHELKDLKLCQEVNWNFEKMDERYRSELDESENILKVIEQTIIPKQECRQYVNYHFGRNAFEKSTHLCTQVFYGHVNPSETYRFTKMSVPKINTGSPLVCNRSLVGIASYRAKAGSYPTYIIYTEVEKYVDWIESTMVEKQVEPYSIKFSSGFRISYINIWLLILCTISCN